MTRPHFLRRIAVACNRAGIAAAELGLLALMLLTAWAVFARYVLESPSVYAMELSTYLLLVVTWAAVGWVHHEDRHVCMEALEGRMGGGWKKIANMVSQLTVLAFCLVLVAAGVATAWTNYAQNYRSASLLEFPLWIAFGLIPLGGLLLALIAFNRLTGGATAGNVSKE